MVVKSKNVSKPQALTSGSNFKATERRFGPVTERGAELGLTTAKTGRIAGRVNPELVRLAKERTGVSSDSELLELALTSLLLEDGFADAFHAARGAVEGDVELGL
jgi:hypothetical protein